MVKVISRIPSGKFKILRIKSSEKVFRQPIFRRKLVEREQAEVNKEKRIKGIAHEIGFGLVVSKTGKIGLIQRQSEPSVTVYPEHWTAPAGHIKKGEKTRQGTIRELREETGFSGPTARVYSKTGYQTKKGKQVYTSLVSHDPEVQHTTLPFVSVVEEMRPPKLNPKEIKNFKWYTPEELLTELKGTKKKFTPNAINIYSEFLRQFPTQTALKKYALEISKKGIN